MRLKQRRVPRAVGIRSHPSCPHRRPSLRAAVAALAELSGAEGGQPSAGACRPHFTRLRFLTYKSKHTKSDSSNISFHAVVMRFVTRKAERRVGNAIHNRCW